MKDLYVIEAVGKIKALAATLRGLGIDAEVVATLGHLYENPRQLHPVGVEIDGSGAYAETLRYPGKPAARAFLEKAIRRANRLVLATDIDQEGHAIANDVADLAHRLGFAGPILRLTVAALDSVSVAHGLRELRPWTPGAGIAGIGRRIADRLIASSCSDPGNGVFVGRVQTALLSLCYQGAVRRRVLTMSVGAEDGGRPFSVSLEAPAGVADAELRSLHQTVGLATVVDTAIEPVSLPLNGAAALLDIEAELGISIADAAELLQDLYEGGELSYPRTAMRAFTGLGADGVHRLASLRGVISFQRNSVPLLQPGEGPHEALRVLEERLQLQKPIQLRATVSEQVLALVGRRSVESGITVPVQTGFVPGLPSWATNVRVARASPGARVPWAVRASDAVRIRERSPQGALVAAMVEHGIGRPSTYAPHAVRLVESGLVDARMGPTAAGLKVLEAAPAGLRDVRRAPEVELCLDRAKSVEEAVTNVFKVLGLQDPALVVANMNMPGNAAAAPDRRQEGHVEQIDQEDEDVPAYRLPF